MAAAATSSAGCQASPPARSSSSAGGTAGRNAAQIAFGLRADVTVIDINPEALIDIDREFDGHITTLMSTSYAIQNAVANADLVIGSVLIPGARAPKLVTNEMVAAAQPGSVFVDIAVDQGGCFADTHATTHQEPTFLVHNSVFYAVANMPGAVPRTSTYALTNATLPFVTSLADRGWREAMVADPVLARGLSTTRGLLTSEPVASAWGRTYAPVQQVLAA